MLIDVIARWNRWGRAQLPHGIERDVLKEILDVLDMSEIVALIGSRRAGKSTVMYQVIDYLETSGVDRKAILHINFEEPSIAENLNLSLLDKIYSTYRNEVYPTGRAYLFFDEIQNIPDWEKWVRARSETEDIKIFITGSSSKLLSRELGTLLTGRHILFTIHPLSFREFLRFKEITYDTTIPQFASPPEIEYALHQYFRWGSYPKIVLTENERQKELLLKGYFDDILFKDIAMRHEIRDLNILRTLTLHLFVQTASLISFKRLAQVFQVSDQLIRNYCQFIRDAFLVEYLQYYSLKAAERNRNPMKVHVIDLGMRQLMSLLHAPDIGRIAETAVFQMLNRNTNFEIYHWKDKSEIDFLIKEKMEVSKLIQVASDGLENPATLKREISSLEEAGAKYKNAEKIIITRSLSTDIKHELQDIQLLPLWKFLLS